MEPLPETRAALERLANLGDGGLAPAVLEMGERAKEIVPDCVGLSLSIVEDDVTLTLVATDQELAVLDAVQYLFGGPCVTAATEDETIEVNREDLFDERRWLMYARATAARGVASSLSLPILRGGQVVGGVNLYAATPKAFEGMHEELAHALGASAAGAVSNADLEFSSRLRAGDAAHRIEDRHEVDLAVGVIATLEHVDLVTARERLRQAAARAGVTEGQAARAVVDLHRP